MKRITLPGAFVLFAFGLHAQNHFGSIQPQLAYTTNCECPGGGSGDKGKFATFGFDLGGNRSNLKFGETQENGDQITNGLGYRLGIVSNFQFTRRFSFAPKAELSFNASRLDQSNTSYNVNAVNLEFLGHLKYKFAKGNFSPYLLSGPNFRVPIQQGESNEIPVQEDWAIDLGAGLDIPLGAFKMSPEIRYSYGLKNITESNSFGDLRFHNIALVLVFTDI